MECLPQEKQCGDEVDRKTREERELISRGIVPHRCQKKEHEDEGEDEANHHPERFQDDFKRTRPPPPPWAVIVECLRILP